MRIAQRVAERIMTILFTLSPITQFSPKIEATKLQKSAKICLT